MSANAALNRLAESCNKSEVSFLKELANRFQVSLDVVSTGLEAAIEEDDGCLTLNRAIRVIYEHAIKSVGIDAQDLDWNDHIGYYLNGLDSHLVVGAKRVFELNGLRKAKNDFYQVLEAEVAVLEASFMMA